MAGQISLSHDLSRMRKFLWIVFGMAFLLGQTLAAERPTFEKIGDLRGLYFTVHDRVSDEDTDLLIERVCQTGELCESLTTDDQSTLRQLEQLGMKGGLYEYFQKVSEGEIDEELKQQLTEKISRYSPDQGNTSGFITYQQFLDFVLAGEGDWLRQEERQILQAYVGSLFWDGESNAPFDLVQDLHAMDEILFGQKSTDLKAEYAEEKEISPVLESQEYAADEEETFDQSESKQSPKNPYSKNDPSIAGRLQELVSLFADHLNPFPLAAEVINASIWESPVPMPAFSQVHDLAGAGQMPAGGSGMAVDLFNEKDWQAFQSEFILNDPLTQAQRRWMEEYESASETVSRDLENQSQEDALAFIRRSEVLQQADIDEILSTARTQHWQSERIRNHGMWTGSFSSFSQYFEEMLTQLENWNESFSSFLQKPRK